jgi:hypothetical protein
MPEDPLQIRIGKLAQLKEPMDEFHVRISAHLAEDGRALDCLVGQGI